MAEAERRRTEITAELQPSLAQLEVVQSKLEVARTEASSLATRKEQLEAGCASVLLQVPPPSFEIDSFWEVFSPLFTALKFWFGSSQAGWNEQDCVEIFLLLPAVYFLELCKATHQGRRSGKSSRYIVRCKAA